MFISIPRRSIRTCNPISMFNPSTPPNQLSKDISAGDIIIRRSYTTPKQPPAKLVKLTRPSQPLMTIKALRRARIVGMFPRNTMDSPPIPFDAMQIRKSSRICRPIEIFNPYTVSNQLSRDISKAFISTRRMYSTF